MGLVFLICLFLWAWTRYGVTDLVAASKGTESPRVAERKQRSAEAHERAMARTGPTIGEAIAGRIADRIQNPPPSKSGKPRGQNRGPARQYAADLWGDSWRRAGDQRRARQQRREAQRNGPEQTGPEQTGPESGPEQVVPDPEAGGGQPTDGGRGPQEQGPDEGWRWRHEDPSADRDRAGSNRGGDQQHKQAAPEPVPGGGDPTSQAGPGSHQDQRRRSEEDPFHGRRGGPNTGRHGDRQGVEDPPIVLVEIVDPDVGPQGPAGASTTANPVVVDGEVVEPAAPSGTAGDQRALPVGGGPASTSTTSTNGTSTDEMASVHPIRKDIPMTSATTHEMGSGEVLNPSDGLQFVTGTAEMMRALDTSVETAISNLAEAGVAGDPIDQLSQIREAVLTVIGSCETAQAHFERHIGTQDQIHSDDTVTGTVNDTYLGRQA